MSSSFTHIGQLGFWCNDTLLEIWAYLLASEIDAQPDRFARLRMYARHLRHQATAGYGGWMHLQLDSLNRVQRADLVAAAHAVLQRIDAQPDLLAPASLNSWSLGGASTFRKPVDARYFRELAHVFVALLEQRWPYTVGDEAARDWYPPEAVRWG